nr:hypothetical protein Iba_chr10eCG10360 [Ipomoea batatas]
MELHNVKQQMLGVKSKLKTNNLASKLKVACHQATKDEASYYKSEVLASTPEAE